MSSVHPISPSDKFVAVTKSDTALLAYNGKPTTTKALYIGGAGDVAVPNSLGTSVVYQNLPAGTVLPVAVNKVLSTGTSATNIVAIFD